MSSLTLQQAIGQVIMTNPDTTDFNANLKLKDVCAKYSPGAFILFSNSIEDQEQVISLNQKIKQACQINPIICCDGEGGEVNRFRKIFPKTGQFSLKKMVEHGQEFYDEQTSLIAESFADLNFNMNLVPVLDHNGGAKSISHYNRSAGTDAAEVYQWAKRMTLNHQAKNITTCMKHFPGQGYFTGDAHEQVIRAKSANQGELESFKLAFKDKHMSQFLMTAHVIIEDWDKHHPVTLSKSGISKIRELGFKGVILSDDIFMKALSNVYTMEDIIVRFFNSGGNMLLVGNSRLSKEIYGLKPLDFFDLVESLVTQGKIKQEVIFDSAYKVLEAKHKLALI